MRTSHFRNRSIDRSTNVQEHRALAHAEAEAAKKRVRAAELRLLAATEEQNLLEELAKRVLFSYIVSILAAGTIVSQNAERLQSVKAFTVSSLGGLASLVPILLAEAGNLERDILSLLATTISSGLYGITYRSVLSHTSHT